MESFTLPHGHPSGTRVSGGAQTESEVKSATISASVEGPAEPTKTTKSRRRKVVAEPAPEVIEDPTEDKPEE